MTDKSEPDAMVIQCGSCRVTVFAPVRGQLDCTRHSPDDDTWYQAVLLECPSCGEAIFATRTEDYFDEPQPHMGWGSPKRVWPRPMAYLDRRIPARVRTNLEEARKCLDAGAYPAAAVMVRRALESVANQSGAGGGSLMSRLARLREKAVIDARMFDWAEALRRHGNLGAHESEGDVTEQDARDLLEFAEAIGEYVFVLTKKFDEFQQRMARVRPRSGVDDGEA